MVLAVAAVAHTDSVDDGAIDNAKATHGHHQQHGEETGHLPATDDPNDGLNLVSELALKNVEPGKIADVGVLGNHAYLAAWGGQTCRYNGVHVVNIADVTAPREVAFIPSKEGSYAGEGVQALPITTSAFSGDILVTNNEQCKPGVGFGGMNIYDISRPSAPTPLAVGFGDDSMTPGQGKKAAHEIHSVFAWDAGDRAYAVMVDNEEAADVDIVDITNPKQPVFIAEYDLAKSEAEGGVRGGPIRIENGLPEVFHHDVIVKKIGSRQVMLVSYWDGGYVQLDVTEPTNAKLINDSNFGTVDEQGKEGTSAQDGVQGTPLLTPTGEPVPPEGNAHQAEYIGTKDRFVLAADEDFGPYALLAKNLTDNTEILASQGSGTTKLEPGQTITGQAKFVGRACNGDPAVPAGDGNQIAVVERGLCTFTEKVANVITAGGYDAILVFNRTASDGCNNSLGMSVEGDIPTFGVAPRQQGFAIFNAPYNDAACLAGDGTQQAPIALGATGDRLTFSSYFDGWGYVRLFNRSDMSLRDTYAIPEAHDPAFADGFGDLSVHEVATSAENPNLAYISYYAAGLRVVDVSSGKVVERAALIDEGGNNFWGVQVFSQGGKEYVAASDRDKGLYIFEYTPVNTP